MLEAVIFDMDGVIIDSHSVSRRLLVDAVRALGCNLSSETIGAWGSLSSRQFWLKVKERFDLSQDLSTLMDGYDAEKEIALYRTMSPIRGVVDLITAIRNEEIHTGLATSASERRMQAVLNIFDMHNLFDCTICDDDVSASKPDPEIYARISAELDAVPARCVAIEDSENGIVAAKRAGMRCVGYTGSLHIDEDLSGADLATGDFQQVTPADLAQLV